MRHSLKQNEELTLHLGTPTMKKVNAPDYLRNQVFSVNI